MEEPLAASTPLSAPQIKALQRALSFPVVLVTASMRADIDLLATLGIVDKPEPTWYRITPQGQDLCTSLGLKPARSFLDGHPY